MTLKRSLPLFLVSFISLILIGVLGIAGIIFLSTDTRIHNHAFVKIIGIDVFEDSGLTKPLTSIEWGMLDPGENKTFDAFLFNPGNVPINLFMTTENWNPINCTSYISFSWDREGFVLQPEESVITTFLIEVDESVFGSGIKEFTFDITIRGI